LHNPNKTDLNKLIKLFRITGFINHRSEELDQVGNKLCGTARSRVLGSDGERVFF